MDWNIQWTYQIQMDQRLSIYKQSIIFLLIISISFGQRTKQERKDPKQANIEQFNLTVSPRVTDQSNKIQLNTYILLPSFALQFIKENGRFQSKFEARISILNRDGEQIDSKTVEQILSASDYVETVSKKNWYFIQHDFMVAPGKYTVVGEVLDVDTRNRGVHVKEVDLTKFNKDFFILDPQVMTYYKGSWQGENKLMPSYKNEIRPQQSIVPVVISGRVSSEDYSIKLMLKNNNDEVIASIDSTISNNKTFLNERFDLKVKNVHGLRGKLNVILSQNDQVDEKEVEMMIKRPGVSSNIRDVDEALDQMRYILTNEERSKMGKAKKKEREKLFYEFWRDRDPTPETSVNELMDQYYNRVRYSNEHFTSFTPGWQTDMGMIYILFGAPDDIERLYMNNSRNANQTWHYYRINRNFTFYDENGFGDYRLSTPYIYGRAW